MPAFDYVEPRTLDEALVALRDPESKCLAGGVSLMVLMRNRLLAPRRLVNLKTIQGLDGISVAADGALRVGPLARHRDLERSALVRDGWRLLAEAAGQIASPVIRNMGTVGGNVCQADPAADLPAALVALHARLRIIGPRGDRELPAAEFQRGYYETALVEDEILREIVIPRPPAGSAGIYLKLRRTATDLPIVGVAVQLLSDGTTCRAVTIAVGAASAVPHRPAEAEALLLGRRVDEALAAEAGRLAGAGVRPLDDRRGSPEYKRLMVGVMVRRAILAAWARAPEGRGR